MEKETRKFLRLAACSASLAMALTAAALISSADGPAAAQSSSCPADEVAVAIYQGRDVVDTTFEDKLQGDLTDSGAAVCAQTIAIADWSQMDPAEFASFDVLWIGNDNCVDGNGRKDFDVAVQTRGKWESVVDPGNVMVAGGDFDLHYEQAVTSDRSSSDKVVLAMLDELSDGPASSVGLVLQAGCYAHGGDDWFQDLQGSFAGLSHANKLASNPQSIADIYPGHQFNVDRGFVWQDWRFGNTCHGGMEISAGSAAETTYNLQPVFKHTSTPGIDCFYMSDENKPPTQTCSSLDTYFLIDDSGSMTSAEVAQAADLANSIQAAIHDVLPDSRFGIARYGGLSQTETVLYIEHDLSAAPVPVSSTRLVPFTSDDHLADAVRAFQTSLFGVPAELQGAPALPSAYDQFTGWQEDIPHHLVIISDGKWDEVDESTMRDYSSPPNDFLAYGALKDMLDFEISLVLDETDDPGFNAERASIPTMGGPWTGGASNTSPDPRRLYLKGNHSAGQIAADIIGNIGNCRPIDRSGPAE